MINECITLTEEEYNIAVVGSTRGHLLFKQHVLKTSTSLQQDCS